MQNTYQFISDKGVFSLPGAADYIIARWLMVSQSILRE